MSDPYQSCSTCWPRACGPEPYRIMCKRREPVNEIETECNCPPNGIRTGCPDPIHARAAELIFGLHADGAHPSLAEALTLARNEQKRDAQTFERPPSGNETNMNNNDERDYSEEAANAELLRNPDPETDEVLSRYAEKDREQTELFLAAIHSQPLTAELANAVLPRLARMSPQALADYLTTRPQPELNALLATDFVGLAQLIEDAILDESEKRFQVTA